MNKIKQYIVGTLATTIIGTGVLMLPKKTQQPEDYIKYAGFNEQVQEHNVLVIEQKHSRYVRLSFDREGQFVHSLEFDIGSSDTKRRIQTNPTLDAVVKSLVADNLSLGPYAKMLEKAKNIQEHEE